MALVGALVCAVLCAGGVLQRTLPAWHDQRWLNLDREQTPAALWSALLLAGAALAWGRLVRAGDAPRYAWTVVGLLGLMAVDEWCELHEDLGALLYTEWQLVYAGPALAAALACLGVLRRWGPGPAASLLVLGGACWAVSQGIEVFEFWGDTDGARTTHGYVWVLLAEEGLEMLGSRLLLLSALSVLPVRVRRPAVVVEALVPVGD